LSKCEGGIVEILELVAKITVLDDPEKECAMCDDSVGNVNVIVLND